MQSTYNIYRMKSAHLGALLKKVTSVGLLEQNTVVSGNYSMTFYFSEAIEGNPVWWWQTYRPFFRDDVKEPKNVFHFALLVAKTIDPSQHLYLVSLGKSHFYLARLIEKDFGINVAIRVANEQSVLLKKSRYFNGAKRQEISSYETFIANSYQAGESVEHLKLKAIDSEVWGEKSIVFADSIQMESAKSPLELSELFDQIDSALVAGTVMRLPKLEEVNDDVLCRQLDAVLFRALQSGDCNVVVEEFEVNGIDFCFRFMDYDYQLYIRGKDGKKQHAKDIGNSLEISDVVSYLGGLSFVPDIGSIKVQFKTEEKSRFTRDLKEVMDFYVTEGPTTYFLRAGGWFAFNQVFLDHLKQSLKNIKHIPSAPLVEADYVQWKEQKVKDIAAGVDRGNKLTYREYYFNEKQSREHGFELMDRELQSIRSMETGKRPYKLEIADLYKDAEVIAVKISEDEKELIYNIEQSRDAITLMMERTVPTQKKIAAAALWFVFEEQIDSITEFNSIQFLLAVANWHRLVTAYKLEARIYVSRHVR